MKKVVKGPFEVKSLPQAPDEVCQEIGAMRMHIEKTFSGALEARGVVSMIGYMNQTLNSGGYVALERITGQLDGVSGSFCLQHSSTMHRGQPSQSITVIPDSGTEGLRGLSGRMVVDIVAGAHSYTFEYEISAS